MPDTIIGLSLLEDEHIKPRGDIRHHPMGTILGNYFYVGDKPGGVEPGFLGIKIDEALISRFNDHYGLTIQPAEFKTYVEKKLREDKTAFTEFAKSLSSECRAKNTSTNLELWLFKQDYNDGEKVAPPLDRLQATNAIQQSMLPIMVSGRAYEVFRKNSKENENINAVLECLGNEIARLYGMPVQDQRLIFGTYLDGHPKLMTACRWDTQMDMIEGKIAGSKEKDEYRGYLVKGEVIKDEEGKPVKDKKGKLMFKFETDKTGKLCIDTSIKNLGEYLALFIAQGDRDVLGSQGQNKGIKNGQLFGFDFGHSYREENPLLKTLNDSFAFIQPTSKSEKFKNMSVFYDTNMSERMLSMFYMYQLADDAVKNKNFTSTERHKIEQAIEAYKEIFPEFKEKITAMQAANNKESEVFNAYIAKFKELAAKSNNPFEKKQYLIYAQEVETAKKRAAVATDTMLTIFKNKLQLTPGEVDFCQNVERLLSTTRETSTDDRVKLTHLRILPEEFIKCQLVRKDNQFELTFTAPAGKTEKLANYLRKFLVDKDEDFSHVKFNVNGADSKITLKIDQHEMQKFIEKFTEEKIGNFKLRHGNFNAPISRSSAPSLLTAAVSIPPQHELQQRKSSDSLSSSSSSSSTSTAKESISDDNRVTMKPK